MYRMKKWLMPVIGCVAVLAFLVMCGEPVPGEDPGLWAFVWPKVTALGVIAGCVWAVRKLDGPDLR